MELSRPVAEALALAASVVLREIHGPRDSDAGSIWSAGTVRDAEIRRVPVDDVARASYADPQEAVEEGAEGVGVLTARRLLDRLVFRRLPKATGADYLMKPPGSVDGDTYERLECSGIGSSSESTSHRLDDKLRQLARYPDHPSGFAVVINFGEAPVEIALGAWRGGAA